MQRHAVRWLTLAALWLAACESGATPSEDERYLSDRDYRRQVLSTAVVNEDNDYSALRMASYALQEDGLAIGWDALPEWSPATRRLRIDDTSALPSVPLNADEELRAGLEPVWDGQPPGSQAEWLALGARVFERWPLQIDDALGSAALQTEARSRYGLWVDDQDAIAGMVLVATADDLVHASWSCASCHARPDADGRLQHGAAAVDMDRGAMNPVAEDGSEPESWSWGPGQVDVTSDGMFNPTAMIDLRAVRYQSHLHWAATLINSLPALAMRIETLMITSASERLRPPRTLPLALAKYLWSLGDGGEPGDASAHPEGAQLFDSNCSACHGADGTTAAPVLLDDIGTDPRVGSSPARTTGRYRVPSLWGVARRGQLLHDGSVTTLEELMSPERMNVTPGHPFGLELEPERQARLLDFVRSIGR